MLHSSDTHYIVAIDETTEGKSRDKTHGIGHFYSSTAGKAINGICMFGFSLINVSTGKSIFLDVEQVIYNEQDNRRNQVLKEQIKAGKIRSKNGEKRQPGRQKGVRNKTKVENNTASYRTFKRMWNRVMDVLREQITNIKITHLVADSAYGTVDYINLARQQGLFLISKLKSNTALYAPKQKTGKRGRPSIYGDKIILKDIEKTMQPFKTETDKNGNIDQFFNFQAYNKSIGSVLLNIVVVLSIRKTDKQRRINVWFSNDLSLDASMILQYYSLRFQIEFDFRDAKQYFGLASFKNYKEKNVTNFINLCFTMCLVSKILLQWHQKTKGMEKLSTIDLKTLYRTRYTYDQILKWLRKKGVTILNEHINEQYVPEELINVA
jgi:putative transposase